MPTVYEAGPKFDIPRRSYIRRTPEGLTKGEGKRWRTQKQKNPHLTLQQFFEGERNLADAEAVLQRLKSNPDKSVGAVVSEMPTLPVCPPDPERAMWIERGHSKTSA